MAQKKSVPNRNRATKRQRKSRAGNVSATSEVQKKPLRRPSSGTAKVIAKMRKKGISLRRAAKEAKVSPRTVVKRAKSALHKAKSGRYTAKSSDLLVRTLMIPTPEGSTEIEVRGLKQASLLGRYWVAVHRYYEHGDKSVQKFAGQSITAVDGTKYPLLTGIDVLDSLGSAGVLSFESLYAGGTNA